MTEQEFKNEYLQLYDAHASNRAAGHNDYTISYWLSSGQEELVKDFLTAKSNRRREGFEYTEARRRKLDHLLRPHRFDIADAQPYDADVNIASNSLVFDIQPLSVMEIKHEHLEVSADDCDGETQLSVIPITHDAYKTLKRNPFRKPNRTKAWRLDLGTDVQVIGGGNAKFVEIISGVSFTSYYLRYVKRPLPIIVGDLTTIGNGTLTIEGQSAPQTSTLDESFHREIITRAVLNSLEAVSNPRMQTFAAMDLKQVE